MDLRRLFARAYQVLAKPVDELVNLLGLEVPVAPIVSLAGIKADGCILHWKAPDPRGSVTGYKVQLNGIIGKSLRSRIAASAYCNEH